MPTTQSVENNFTRGLISQATGMNFPENACVSTQNCVFRPWGLVERRLGIDVETAHQNLFAVLSGITFNQYVWKDATGNGNIDLVVVQIGGFLYFYRLDTINPSNRLVFNSLVLVNFTGGDPGSNIVQTQCQFASGNGYLFVFNSFCSPFYVSYNPITNLVTANITDVQFRDTYGIDEAFSGTLDNTRPVVTPPNHTYNLQNQGWTNTMIGQFNAQINVYPSNNDIPWIFNVSTTPRNFDRTAVNALIPVSGKAPKGHFVLSVFGEDRALASGIGIQYPTNYPQQIGTGNRRFSTGAFWAGRVWYAGLPVQGFNNRIYFSQVAVSIDQFNRCYQANDPTNPTLYDILPTDGGIIVIQEIGTIYKLFPYQNALFIFSNTGVWAITGSSGTGLGFTASDYTVHKISSVPSISSSSFVDLYGLPVWWNLTCIYTITSSQEQQSEYPTGYSGGFTVQSLSDASILNYFATIPTISKINARGAFDPIYGIIQWTFRSTNENDVTSRTQFDSILNYNMQSKAFYNWTIPIATTFPTNYLIGLFYDDMIIPGVTPRFKYLAVTAFNGTLGNVTFAETNGTTFTDWVSTGVPQDYSSFITTGYKLHGQVDKRIKNLVLTIYFQNRDASQSETIRVETIYHVNYI